MEMHTPPECQGQTVNVSYGMWGGYVYRHTHDRGDQSHSYARSVALIGDEGDYWDEEPKNRRWKSITEAEFIRQTR